jgi:hypothetical protein
MLPFNLNMTVKEFVELALYYDAEPFLNECKADWSYRNNGFRT